MYSVIDIFAGAGGLSEGFSQKGYEVELSCDSDTNCCNTLRTRKYLRELIKTGKQSQYVKYLNQNNSLEEFCKNNSIYKTISEKVLQMELKQDNIKDFHNSVMDKTGQKSIDVLIGGPPCQAYSIAGRSRDEHNKTRDKRHYLFRIYLNIIERLKPKFFIYENVPGLLSASTNQGNISDLFEKEFLVLKTPYIILPKDDFQNNLFNDNTFRIKDHIIDMSKYGVPQKRKRVILIGVRKDIYKKLDNKLSLFWSEFEKFRKSPVSCKEALSGLPILKAGSGDIRRSEAGYKTRKFSPYATGLKSRFGILNHQARNHMRSDLDRYKYFIKKSINGYKPNLNDLAKDKPDLLPAHKNLKIFIDRFKVQVYENPASTITAHIQKDGHYYIHPDIKQLRSLTVREAARIQGFPDDYFFEGNRGEQFKQVGNAVPPVFSALLADNIKYFLDQL